MPGQSSTDRPNATYGLESLRNWCAAILRSVGLSRDDASIAADVLVRTDARGFLTHGLVRLPSYVSKLRDGEVSPTATPVENFNDGFGIVQAGGALGQVAARFTIDRAIARTTEHPVATFMLRDSGHLGALGVHVLRAAEAGRVALVMQATPPIIALPGATGPMLGNNPFAVAAPRPGGPPIVVDMACSVAARGNILIAAREGHPIPEGWALDEHGDATTDAAQALRGSLLPFASYKGLAMAAAVELLAGSLSGATYDALMNKGGRVQSATGHLNALFMTFNPNLIAGQAQFESHVAAWTAHYKTTGGKTSCLPGERAYADEQRSTKDGIAYSDSIIAELSELGREWNVPFPNAGQSPSLREKRLQLQ